MAQQWKSGWQADWLLLTEQVVRIPIRFRVKAVGGGLPEIY
jgi:hypothetical protein